MRTGEVQIKKSLEHLQHFLRICTLSFLAIILGYVIENQQYKFTWLLGYLLVTLRLHHRGEDIRSKEMETKELSSNICLR